MGQGRGPHVDTPRDSPYTPANPTPVPTLKSRPGQGLRALEVVMIRAENAPILWKSTASSPERAMGAVFVFCDSRKAHVEKQCPKVRGEY